MDFCLWAPWVFSALAGLAGWLLRAWYEERNIKDLQHQIKVKEEDIFHLHEAHELLLNDKEQKLSHLQAESDIQKKSIEELKLQLEADSKPSKSRATSNGKKKIAKAISSGNGDTPQAKSTQILPFATSEDIASANKDNKKKSGKKKKLKKKIEELSRLISKLQSKNDKIKNELKKSEGKKRKVKKVPYTIVRTIRISEIIDRKKLVKALQDVPIIKTKKSEQEKVVKGKPKK